MGASPDVDLVGPAIASPKILSRKEWLLLGNVQLSQVLIMFRDARLEICFDRGRRCEGGTGAAEYPQSGPGA
jgi:hypothetical protein